MSNTVVIVGAGFSAAAKIPTTSDLLQSFVATRRSHYTPSVLQSEITKQLRKFWVEVFGWNQKRRNLRPTFEAHFTTLDLAANTGHQLRSYTPSALRAIRRFSLHRVFETLDTEFQWSRGISWLMERLAVGNNNAVVSTNWDIVVEKHLARGGYPFRYGAVIDEAEEGPPPDQCLSVFKLHGSANWCYCDACRRVVAYPVEDGKAAYRKKLFIEERDFRALDHPPKASLVAVLRSGAQPPVCPHCDVRVSARVATFSFEKALGFFQFQGAWEDALRVLRKAERWIFIGYSLPDADFSLRHLLKTAQLSDGRDRILRIDVVLKGDVAAAARYRQLFGTEISKIHMSGFDSWWKKQLKR